MSMASHTNRICAIASGAPRQKCDPAPNHNWRTVAAVLAFGSKGPNARLAAKVARITRSPARTATGPMHPAATTDRSITGDGVVTRRASAIAGSTSERSVAAGCIGPVAVRAGDRVILATFAANRALGPFDPKANTAATVRQLWFGAGSHFCLGAPLAMAQIRLVCDAILGAAPLGDLRVISRRPARGVLIPSYSTVVIGK